MRVDPPAAKMTAPTRALLLVFIETTQIYSILLPNRGKGLVFPATGEM
jgi:hypothetical protein